MSSILCTGPPRSHEQRSGGGKTAAVAVKAKSVGKLHDSPPCT